MKPKILIQLDADPQPSVFDSVVAVDAGVEHLLRHGGITPDAVRDLVHGAIFTRGPQDLASTAIFIGGSNVAAGEKLLAAVIRTFFGPMRVSVMLDANGANTTAAAAVLSAGKHVDLSHATALVLGGTGPVGQRAVRLLARAGALVRVGSRSRERAQRVCDEVAAKVAAARLSPYATDSAQATSAALDGVNLLIAAGSAGVELLSADARRNCRTLAVAIDLNAVPPLGLAGIDVMDRAAERDGAKCYGAIGVGGLKMKIHKAGIRKLFESNDQVLDAEQIYDLGQAYQSPTLPSA
jgi:hypothetical protein